MPMVRRSYGRLAYEDEDPIVMPMLRVQPSTEYERFPVETPGKDVSQFLATGPQPSARPGRVHACLQRARRIA